MLARAQRHARALSRARFLEHRETLDATFCEWSQNRDGSKIEALLQSHGVPAHLVQNLSEAFRDPQFVRRGHFVELDHPALSKFTVESPHVKLSPTPAAIRRVAPTLGHDNQYVLEELLGYDEDKITDLLSSGALD